MFSLLGILKDPVALIKGLLIAAVLACVGYVVYDYFNTKGDLVQAKIDVAVITAERNTTANLLLNERAETNRVNVLLVDAKTQRVKAEVIYVDRQVKVIEYKNDPTVQHCDLDIKWMQLANEAAVYPYADSQAVDSR